MKFRASKKNKINKSEVNEEVLKYGKIENIFKDHVKDFEIQSSKVRLYLIIGVLILWIVGSLLNNLSNNKEMNLYEIFSFTLMGLASTTFTILVINWFSETFMHKSILRMVTDIFNQVIDEKMPARYDNLKKIGIVDAFKPILKDKIANKFDEASDTTIRFLKIHIQDFDYYYERIKDAIISRNCKVEILLLDKKSDEAIDKRAYSLRKRKAKFVQTCIQNNIDSIQTLYWDLPDDKRNNLILKFHKSFVAVSLIGIGEEFYVGFYLKNISAPSGVIIKVAGSYRTFYKDLNRHFEEEWSEAKEYKFKEKVEEQEIDNT